MTRRPTDCEARDLAALDDVDRHDFVAARIGDECVSAVRGRSGVARLVEAVQDAFGWIVTPSLDRGTFCVLDRQGRLARRVQVSPSSHDACFVMTA